MIVIDLERKLCLNFLGVSNLLVSKCMNWLICLSFLVSLPMFYSVYLCFALPCLFLIIWLAFLLGASVYLSKLDVLDLSQLIENAFQVPNRQMV